MAGLTREEWAAKQAKAAAELRAETPELVERADELLRQAGTGERVGGRAGRAWRDDPAPADPQIRRCYFL